MVVWRPLTVVLALASAVAGVWLLAVSPEPRSDTRSWRPGEVIAITEDTGEREWSWSFRLPNEGDEPLRVRVTFTSNISVVHGDDEGLWEIRTLLLVEGVQLEPMDGYSLGGLAFDAHGNWNRHPLVAEWTLPPGRESTVEANVKNEATPVRGRDWRVDYDPMQFEVTTTTQALDWALAGPGAGLLVAGFAAVAAVAVPNRA